MATTTVLTAAEAAQLNTLRAELKQWEKSFSDANGGRKAGREDIKRAPEIAAKYKTYGRLRALESSSSSSSSSNIKSDAKHKTVERTPSKSDQHHAQAKRKYAALENDSSQTPQKPRRELFTPAKNRTVSDPHHPAALDPYDSPSVFRRLFSPSTHRQTQPSPLPLKNAIGPTPQRDGKALGLFDLLSASGGSTATPSTKRVATLGKDIMKTPSGGKRNKMDDIAEKDEEEDEGLVRMGRTPASSSKKLYLERLFATPTTMRFATMVEDEESQQTAAAVEITQADTNPLSSETPSFLRRSNSGRYIPSTDPSNGLSPVGIRKPQRFVGKGLSALVQGLRDIEEERMQDDWDVLRELEAEQEQNAQGHPGEDVQVGDSQVPAHGTDIPDSGRIWKKKAPKRSTRLVRLKPVVHVKPKPTQTTTTKVNKTAEEEESDDELFSNAVPIPSDSTSLHKPRQNNKEPNNEDDEECDDLIPDDSSDPDFDDSTKKSKPTSSFSEKMKAALSAVKNPFANTAAAAAAKSKSNSQDQEAEKASKKRKINPEAHANYRSLKIRSKGQRRFGKGRFGRR